MKWLRRTFTPRELRTIAWVALAASALIVFTGAAVRLTGSGLGCPDWPRCEGTRLTPALQTHTLIEFGNRMMTSVVGIPCFLALWAAWRRRPFRSDLLKLAAVLPLSVAGQAVLGGLTVLYGLKPGWVIAHFLLSMAMLVACVALVWRATYEPGSRPRATDWLSVWAVRLLLLPGAAVLAGGTVATAAGPHAGGEGTGDFVPRIMWHGAETMDWAIRRHGTTAAVFGILAVAVWLLLAWRRPAPSARTPMTVVCLLVAAQGAVGLTQYALELPPGIVWVHVVLATLTWLALLWAVAAAGRLAPRVVEAREPEPAREFAHAYED